MRILLINSVCGVGSTGRICTDIAKEYEVQGHDVRIAYGRKDVPEQFRKYAIRIGNDFDVKAHGLCSRLFDNSGYGSKRATKSFLKWADDYDPELLWLHNIHGYYINIDELFNWIKSRPEMNVKWTLHDCWAFTGHCSHFIKIKCNKWKYGCVGKCPGKKEYPATILFNNNDRNYKRKKELFTEINNLEIVVPCKWLKDQVRQSYLKDYPITVCYNKIDRTLFRPTESDFRKKYGLENYKIILAVAPIWTAAKGLLDLMELSKIIYKNSIILVVGVDKKLEKLLGSSFVSIRRTNDKRELAGLYTTADYFVNLTHADTYPTVNLEARACGTRIITYDVGGCRETIGDKDYLVPEGDIKKVADIINEGK